MRQFSLFIALVSFSTALFASGAADSKGPGVISNVLLLGGFLFIFYFMLIRPQTKRAKEQQALISGVAKDDEVIISGGLLGKVAKVTDQFLIVIIADGIEVKVQKQAISASVPKGTMKSI